MFRNSTLYLLASLWLFTSCKHYYYAPNTLNLPTVREKGDLSVDFGIAGGNNMNGWEARAAYVPVKNIVVSASHTKLGGSFEETTSFFDPTTGQFTFTVTEKSGKGYLTEGQVGYLLPRTDYLTLSLMAGGGAGRVYNDFGKDQSADLHIRRFSLQPGIMMSGELAEFGCGLRFSHLDFYNGRITYNADNPEIDVLEKIDQKAPFFLTDFGMTAGLKFSSVHLRGHFVFSLFENNDLYNFASNNASVSMSVDINKLLKKQK